MAEGTQVISLDDSGRLVPFSVFMRCTENDVEYDYDGGKVLLQAIGHQHVADLNACNFVLNVSRDGERDARTVMHAFPVTRPEMKGRYFKITCEEIDCPIPPEPEPVTSVDEVAKLQALVAELEAKNAELQQRSLSSGPAPEPEDEDDTTT